jgi:hypothetical protein
MRIHPRNFKTQRRRGALMVELIAAMALVATALLPIAYSIASERRLALACYQRAVAMEIVDGEMETLIAGQWQAFAPRTQEYPVRAVASTNLPPGRFLLTIETHKIRLEWRPSITRHGGPVVREVTFP